MDKAEYQSKLEQLTSLANKEDYKGALEIVESVDWRRVKSIRTLSMVADVYEANKMYPEANDILLLAYDRASIGKGILYRLVDDGLILSQWQQSSGKKVPRKYYQITADGRSSLLEIFTLWRELSSAAAQIMEDRGNE